MKQAITPHPMTRFFITCSSLVAAVIVAGVLFIHPKVVLAQANRPATIINSDIITNTTWTEANSPYDLTTSVNVVKGAVLTIEAGVVVRASQSVEFKISGELHANGTDAKPILFTGSTAQAGWWYGITINGTSLTPLSGSTLDFVTVEHSGKSGYGNLNLSYAKVEITHSTFRNSSSLGIRGSTQGSANIADSAITNNAGVAIEFGDGSVRPLLTNLTVSGNGTNVIEFGNGTISEDYTWRALGVPYVINSINVAVGATLTVEAGVEARFTQSAYLDVRGKFLALGTADKPILFTGTTAQAGWWYGLALNGTSLAPLTDSTLTYLTIEHSGKSGYGNLNLNYAQVAIDHCTFRNSSGSGMRGQTQGSATIANSIFTNNALFPIDFQDGSVLPILSNLIVNDNGTNAIRFGNGTIDANYTWRSLGVPYQFDSLNIAANTTLTIEAGVEARFTQSSYLDVRGKILALGTAAKPILLTGSTAQPGHWYGVALNGTSLAPLTDSQFDYVTIEFSGKSGYANLNLTYATATISHSQFRNSSASGIRGLTEGRVLLSDSSFTGNAEYPIQFTDGSVDAQLSKLTISGNGTNAIYFANGTLSGNRIWRALGVPYIFGSMNVPAGSTLTVEPGVEARFTQAAYLDVRGRLIALGNASAPITFTAATTLPTPGWWYGIAVSGYNGARATAELDYVTVEFSGRSNYGNLNITRGQVAIKHSLLQHSSGNGMTVSFGSSVTIEASRIIDNAGYAIQNVSSQEEDVVNASNNWWGSASGPTSDGACNPGGTGGKVSVGVSFKPFLTAIDQKPGPLLLGDARIITITPKRWFAPADGLTRAFVSLSLHDGNGKPLPGRKLKLSSTLGSATSGGVTDAQGATTAYVVSSVAGDAELGATFDRSVCETAKSPTSKITFTSQAVSELSPAAEAPYLDSGLKINPEPIIRGVPTRLSARLTNPNDFPILVDATFGYVQSSIGLAFGPVGEVLGKEIPAKSTSEIAIVWVPSVSGHYCIQLTYTSRAKGVAASEGNSILQSGRSQRNLNVYPGPLGSKNEKDSLDKADKAFKLVSKAPGTKQLPIQKFIVGKWWNWIKETASDISKNLGGDPPRQDFRTIAVAERLTLPPIVADGQTSAARAAAINAVTEALLDANASGLAATISLDRYAGAAEANDLEWMSLQAGALLYHKQEMAKALLVAADRIDALRQLAIAEGTTSIPVTADEFRAYQQELAANGFSAQEIADAKQAGLSDAQIEANKQELLATKAEDAAGDVLVKLEAWATAYRELGNAILFPPLPSFSVSGGGGGLVQTMAAGATATPDTLARVFTTVGEFQLGNPLSTTATIDLVIRRVDLPADWLITTTPVSVTLAAGEQTTVQVNIIPGGAALQGAMPRVAIEGYAGSELLGGVVMDVIVPRYAPFDGKLRVYLPMVAR